MMLHPEIQKKVHTELDQVTGGTRIPTTADRKNTPYTEAVIQEIFRKANVFPVTFHASLNGGYLDGGKYFVPPKTSICLNLSSLLNDPGNFVNPEEFNPGRYLDSDGCFHPNKKVVSFGLGKRRCPGNNN